MELKIVSANVSQKGKKEFLKVSFLENDSRNYFLTINLFCDIGLIS